MKRIGFHYFLGVGEGFRCQKMEVLSIFSPLLYGWLKIIIKDDERGEVIDGMQLKFILWSG